jgi:long-chain acyl-CoA synthetase
MSHAEATAVPVNLHARHCPGPAGLELRDRHHAAARAGAQRRAFGSQAALREKDKGIWQQTSWQQALDAVLACAAGLDALGFGPGMALMVLGDNRPRLYLGMLAAGALPVTRCRSTPTPRPTSCATSRRMLAVHVALADDQEQVDKVLDLRDNGAASPTWSTTTRAAWAATRRRACSRGTRCWPRGRKRLDARAGLRQSLLDRATRTTRRCWCIRRVPPGGPRACR